MRFSHLRSIGWHERFRKSREIRGLKPDEQERLLRALVEELDGPPDPGVEQAWLEEAQRRSRELDSGAVTGISAEEVLAKARTELKPR